MKRRIACNLMAMPLLASLLAVSAASAEIEFHSLATPRGPLVRLSDVAAIRANDGPAAAQLGQLELLLAPADGQQRYLRAREIQDLLAARGVRLSEHRFLGARDILVTGGSALNPTSDATAATSPADLQSIAAAAIERYLRGESGPPWRVDLKLGRDQLAALASAVGSLRVERPSIADSPPSATGRQRFQIHLTDAAGRPSTLSIDADIAQLAPRVVAVRSLPRGVLVRAEDVRIEFVDPANQRRQGDSFTAVGEIIGQETRQSIEAGQPLAAGDVRKPVLVRRGEEVRVYARSGGVNVSTTAIARDEGSYGELILVEMPEDRSKIYARVSGPAIVDVMAASAQATDAPARR
jgi:flagella basal body P-ring formation protein FlgA